MTQTQLNTSQDCTASMMLHNQPVRQPFLMRLLQCLPLQQVPEFDLYEAAAKRADNITPTTRRV